MKSIVIPVLAAGCALCTFGQVGGNATYQTTRAAVSIGAFQAAPATPVTGAPYSATITNQMTQTLEDGSHIVQKTSGSVARDSEGRTRQDAPLPAIGNLSAANAPHIVFIHDPVAQVSYTLDLTNNTAQKMSTSDLPTLAPKLLGDNGVAAGSGPTIIGGGGAPLPGAGTFVMQVQGGDAALAAPLPAPPVGGPVVLSKALIADDPSQVITEDLGSQTMEGVTVTGTRTTRVIPVGQIGNDAPLSIVTEVWTSPELKTIVYSKRTDPRMGVQIFQLTNIIRTEPDPSLFTVPSGFQVVDGPQPIVYRTNQ